MPFLQPDFTALCYRDLRADFFKERGIRVLLLDIDNTLAPYEQPEPDEHISAWLAELAEAGVQTAFLSNNHGPRVELFNKTLGRPCRYNARKPLARRGKELMRSLGGDESCTAMMGDQVFTDVLVARAMGVRAILVPPIKDKTDALTRFKRYLERGVLRRYHKRHPDAPDVREGSTLTKEYV